MALRKPSPKARSIGEWRNPGRLYFGYFLFAKQKKVSRLSGRDPTSKQPVAIATQQKQNPPNNPKAVVLGYGYRLTQPTKHKTLLSNRPFQTNSQQRLRLHRKLHRQFLKHFLTKSIHNHRYRIFGRQAALLTEKQLILADF